MKQRDELHQGRLAELRKDISVGVDQADLGQERPFDDAVAARVKTRGRKRLAGEKGSDPA